MSRKMDRRLGLRKHAYPTNNDFFEEITTMKGFISGLLIS